MIATAVPICFAQPTFMPVHPQVGYYVNIHTGQLISPSPFFVPVHVTPVYTCNQPGVHYESPSASPSFEADDEWTSNNAPRWEKDMDFDRMTMERGGTMFTAEYQYKMNYLNTINCKEEVFQFDVALLNLNAERNSYLEEDVLDLHGLPRTLAQQVLTQRADEIRAEYGSRTLYVCTGKGLHSSSGKSKIKEDLEHPKTQKNIGYTYTEMEGNKGVLVLQILPRQR